ncbi:16109_t:CDS:2 [Entrophospora sp. SA101]|nr:16109_t:CDS:2 [Entrophospora sp. SA101]
MQTKANSAATVVPKCYLQTLKDCGGSDGSDGVSGGNDSSGSDSNGGCSDGNDGGSGNNHNAMDTSW